MTTNCYFVPRINSSIITLQSARVYKRHSSVIPSSHILDEVQEVQPGTDRAEIMDRLNGIQTSDAADVQRSTLVFGRPSSNLPSTSTATKVQLRTQRSRLVSRPISMPLERLPTRAQVMKSHDTAANANANPDERDLTTEVIQEAAEPEKTRPSGSSRVSTYYITPFIDTQTMQRRTWDRKYKHYDVTPRTAMIVANLPPTNSGAQPAKATAPATGGSQVATPSPASIPTSSSVSTIFPNHPYTVSIKPMWTSKRENDTDNSVSEPSSSTSAPITFRAPRTLQPPPGTFYKPPVSIGSRARTLPNWTTTVTTITNTTASHSLSNPTQVVTSSPDHSSPPQTRLQTQDSVDSATDPEVSTSATLSPPQSPPPSSPDDLSPSEAKLVYQRLRPRRLQELEHREAHFV